GVLARDDFALLGDADLPLHAALGLREDGLIARTATAPDGGAAALEQAQLDTMPFEYLDQLDGGLVQLPVRGEIAAVLVAVRVAQHDFLHTAAALQHATVFGYGEQRFHDGAAAAQISDRLEQRNDVEGKARRRAGLHE